MLQLTLFVLILGVLLSEVKSDIICYEKRLAERIKMLDNVDDVDTMCGMADHLVNTLRQDLKECEMNKVSVDGYEAFANDFCADGSEMKTTFQNNGLCLINYSSLCVPKITEELMSVCLKRQSIFECYRDKVGKPCGAEHLMDRVTEAMESYYKGICAEIGGASANKAFTWSLLGVVFALVAWWY